MLCVQVTRTVSEVSTVEWLSGSSDGRERYVGVETMLRQMGLGW